MCLFWLVLSTIDEGTHRRTFDENKEKAFSEEPEWRHDKPINLERNNELQLQTESCKWNVVYMIRVSFSRSQLCLRGRERVCPCDVRNRVLKLKRLLRSFLAANEPEKQLTERNALRHFQPMVLH